MAQDIKTKRLKYLECLSGEMHEGEVLNFICIDPKC
jgi:hypothetical protein